MPKLQKDPLYDEPVNIDLDPEEALRIVLQVEPSDEDEEPTK